MLPLKQDKTQAYISFAGAELIFDSAGALFWPQKNLLVVADMHLEKGSYLAKQGNPLPLYDTFDTLKRLEGLIAKYHPQRILSLGDNIHDNHAFIRMSTTNNGVLKSLFEPIEQWVWLMGNHDKNTLPPDQKNMIFCTDYQEEHICFTHEAKKNTPFQILGHYHPTASYKKIRGKCFVAGSDLIVMPSFGTYTGGLDISSAALQELLGSEDYRLFLLHHDKIWQIPSR